MLEIDWDVILLRFARVRLFLLLCYFIKSRRSVCFYAELTPNKTPKLKLFCNSCLEFFESEKFVNDILQFLVVIELELELEY